MEDEILLGETTFVPLMRVQQPRTSVPRLDPGGQRRPDEGGGQVRVPPRIQVFHLCHVVDPPGNQPRHCHQARTIRLPVHMIEVVNKLLRTSRQLVQALGREPTSAEIAKQMDIPQAKVRKALKIMRVPISLETPIGEEGDSHLSDLIEDRTRVSPAEAVINVSLKERTAHVLRTLSPREEKILRMRFGIEDGLEHTLEEVGRSFAVTRERIRQIEARPCANCAIHRAPSSSGHFCKMCVNALARVCCLRASFISSGHNGTARDSR